MQEQHGRQLVASYKEKVAHIQEVAERGAEVRKQLDAAGQRHVSRRHATRVFKAMAVKKHGEAEQSTVLVFSDTPIDREFARGLTVRAVSPEWAKHVRRVFVWSFLAAEPKPTPPTS